MWIFSRYGFVSVVCARKDNGKSAAIDPDKMMIRGRVRSHMDALKARFPQLIRGKLKEDAGTDYRWRFIVPRKTWDVIAAALASEVDYC